MKIRLVIPEKNGDRHIVLYVDNGVGRRKEEEVLGKEKKDTRAPGLQRKQKQPWRWRREWTPELSACRREGGSQGLVQDASSEVVIVTGAPCG